MSASSYQSPSIPVCQVQGMKSFWRAPQGFDFIVTGNKRYFPPRSCGSIRIVNAAELLDRITLEM